MGLKGQKEDFCMKKITLKKSNLILLLLIVVFSSCLKDNDNTIILPTFNGEISDAVIPPEIREELEGRMNIYEGQTPPDIIGEYVSDPHTLVYSSDGQFTPGDVFADRFFAFEEKDATGMVIYEGKQGSSISYANSVIVVGKGNDFTAYFVANTEDEEDGTNSKSSYLISGTVTPNGIKNFEYAFIMLDKDDPNGKLMDVNEYRIFTDGDGLAENNNWVVNTKKNARNGNEPLFLENIKSKNTSK